MSGGETSFRVPFGADPQGAIVAVESAVKGTAYACPACATLLVLRAGEVRAKHFGHRAETGCTPETVLHDTAKRRIAASVMTWRAGHTPHPSVSRACPDCGSWNHSPISDRAMSAVTEYRLANGRVLDVAVLDGAGAVLLGVEVLVSHAVEDSKEADLKASGVPWVEVAADKLNGAHYWPAIRTGGKTSAFRCESCATRSARRRQQTADIAARHNLGTPAPGYLAIEIACYRCSKPTPVFYWPGIGFERTPPEPRPGTVKMRYSATLEREYWSNGCVHCHALIGGHWLYGYLSDWLGNSIDAEDICDAIYEPSTAGERRMQRDGAVAAARWVVSRAGAGMDSE